jgi:uroporphyrinogen decarboxylase
MIPYHALFDHPRYPVFGPIPPDREGERRVDEDGFQYVVHGYTEWIERRPFNNLSGFLAYLERKTEVISKTVPVLPVDFPERLEFARQLLGDTCIAIPYLGAGLDALYPIAGWNIFAQAVVEAPEMVGAYLDALADNTVELVHLYAQYITADHCPVALGAYSDIAYNRGLLVSPSFLKKALLPAVRKITSTYHEHGIKVIYHSEGDLMKVINDLITVNIDGINPLSSSENMDPVEVRNMYPDLVLWGGINERNVLVDGSIEQVRQEVERVVSGVRRGLILGSSGGVHPGCKVENCLEMVRVLKDMETL